MGSGIAKEIRKRYPKAYELDCQTKRGDEKKLGQFTCALQNSKQNKTIFNLYSQYKYGRDGKQYTDYQAMETGLIAIRDFLIKMNMQDQVIGIPYLMGCGLGGGDWKVVEKIISFVFSSTSTRGNLLQPTNFNILICKLEK